MPDSRTAPADEPAFVAKRIPDMDSASWGTYVRARAELGVRSFGMQVIDLPPDVTAYPEHTEEDSGQEEVFVLLAGGGFLRIDDEDVPLDPETLIRVAPRARRKLLPGGEGARVLILGGVPGEAYAPTPYSEIGGPDPMRRARDSAGR
jgi:mannose-6-phosphate isomerase-like protein (cupin superfamily)